MGVLGQSPGDGEVPNRGGARRDAAAVVRALDVGALASALPVSRRAIAEWRAAESFTRSF
jgi:hypothetical protein